jgi:hypothetical protein
MKEIYITVIANSLYLLDYNYGDSTECKIFKLPPLNKEGKTIKTRYIPTHQPLLTVKTPWYYLSWDTTIAKARSIYPEYFV